METGYRDSAPTIGDVHAAFRTFEDIEEFIEDQVGDLIGEIEIYEIWGDLVQDDGGPDGLYIRVEDYKVLFI